MRIRSVIKTPNGLSAVFDENGRQVPELQGEWEEKAPLIYAEASGDTRIYDGGCPRNLTWLRQEATAAGPVMKRLPSFDCFWCGKEAVPVVQVVWGLLHANITVCGPCLARALRVVNEED